MPISRTDRPTICVTVGDPRGIGPEVVRNAIAHPSLKNKANFLVIGKASAARKTSLESARESVEFIDAAFELIIKKKADALVTGPVSKEAINSSGIKFKGHTEYLADLCGSPRIAMMFISDKLKLSLVTRHMALSEVSRAISIKAVYDTAELTCKALKDWFWINNPKVGISGLNPHCGEGGLFGGEEETVIRPAVEKLSNYFKGVAGPIPADTLLYEIYNKRYDAAVCMYHDQGLAAFKMISRNKGVNLTLGLPFIRTSPDHGTAFDIAGKSKADPGSMIEALKLAIRLVKAC
ncbi:MAG: 4-hydroxythreonine-4-phosphate dehydrogenase PdxA [Candidatus Omnitrophica bacterium]|nr:4-hydroxythreonine-4-phosphate dehydrogenase PdxA [Candidatus Omnitrophota bacterium]